VLNCPKCGSPRVYRSRSRTFLERFRKNFTRARMHRCHACDWRGWGRVTTYVVGAKDQPEAPQRPAAGPEPVDVPFTRDEPKKP
jgi:hypothetical protein